MSCTRSSSHCATDVGDKQATENKELIGLKLVQQGFVGLDEGRLLLRIELARHRLWLAMLQAEPMQQRDQARPALVLDAALRLDPSTDLARGPRQRLGDPGLQLVLLFFTQAARTALVAEARQALDAFFLIEALPGADRVVVHQQDFRRAPARTFQNCRRDLRVLPRI